ncbi:MAG: MMPL family transporter, partial [Frankiaceae bacterium]
MLDSVGRVLVRRARLVLLGAAVLVVLAGAVGLGAFAKLKSAGFEASDSGTVRARAILATEFGGEPDLVLLVRTPGSVDGAAGTAAGRAVTDRLAAERGVTGVHSYWTTPSPGLRSRDGRAGLVLAHVSGGEQAAAKRTQQLTDAFSGPAPGGATVAVGGGGAIGNEITGQVATDLARAESVAVPLTLLLLILAFGSLVAALLPLAISLIAIVGTFAVLSILADLTDVSVFALNLTTALGLGLAIDYALLMVSRYREELARGAGIVGRRGDHHDHRRAHDHFQRGHGGGGAVGDA